MNEETLEWLNSLQRAQAIDELLRCCGSRWWCQQVADARPFGQSVDLTTAADVAFDAMPKEAWLEAIRRHPKIGDFQSLKMKFTGNREWSAGEQSAAVAASEETLRSLAAANLAYEQRFGYLFVICATGKSAQEMLDSLETRLHNDPTTELQVATSQQRMITHLRLAKLLPPTEP